mmetsp:Transcript_31248/g.56726  ORF Transcript_31248/g.56726 Transcript_31248/m.56726 type:complete len:290 (-) Transcript_31248:473-1342(-)
MVGQGDFKGGAAGNDGAVVEDVLDGAETIARGFFDLGDGVVVLALDQDGAGVRVGNTLHEGVFLLTQYVLVDLISIAKALGLKLLHGVDAEAAASTLDTLHVALLSATKSDNALLGEQVKRERVNTLLVDDNKGLVPILATDLTLEIHDLADTLVRDLALRRHKGFTLLRIAVEEAAVNLTLLVLETDIATEDIAFLKALGHVGMAGPMVENQTLNKLSIRSELVTHMHDLYHVQVDGLLLATNAKDGIGDNVGQLIREVLAKLRTEASTGDTTEEFAVNTADGLLEAL